MSRFIVFVVLSILLVSALAHNTGKKHAHKDRSNHLRNAFKQVSGAIECSICSWLVGQVQNYLAQNQTETEIVTAIEGDCSVFGPLASLCKTLVGTAVPDIINYLNQNYPPSQICDVIGLCGSTTGSTGGSSSGAIPKVRKGGVSKSAKPNAPQGLECDICTYVVTQVDTYLENNNTIEEIEQFLDNDCQIFGPFSSTCITLVNTYLPDIVNYLEQDYPPSVVCQLIGLCGSSTTSSSAPTPASSSSSPSSGPTSSTGTSSGSSGAAFTKKIGKIGKKLKKEKALKSKVKISSKKSRKH